MSQAPLPPVPPAVGQTYPSPGMGPVKQTNVMAIVSLICGILGCIPVITSLVAIITGFLGIKKADDPRVNGGKGLAIAGLLLGVVGLIAWAGIGYGTYRAGSAVAQAVMAAPNAGKAFMTDLASGNVTAAHGKTTGLTTEEVQQLVDQVKPWGAFKDSTGIPQMHAEDGVTRAAYMGTADFANGQHGFVLTFQKVGDDLKVDGATLFETPQPPADAKPEIGND